MSTRVTKVPSAVALYAVQFAQPLNSFLNSGEFLSSAAVICSATAIGISSITNTGSAVLFFVGSGQARAEYPVDIVFSTNFGRGDVASLMIRIEDRKYVAKTGAP